MREHLTRLLLVLALGGFSATAAATPCPGCLGSCADSKSSNCGCVTIEGCVCCGGSADTLAAPGTGGQAMACVTDLRGGSRCGVAAKDPGVAVPGMFKTRPAVPAAPAVAVPPAR